MPQKKLSVWTASQRSLTTDAIAAIIAHIQMIVGDLIHGLEDFHIPTPRYAANLLINDLTANCSREEI